MPTAADWVALGWCALIVLLPGAGAALAVHRPGAVGLPTRIALVFALGVGVSGVTGLILAVGRILHPWSFFPLLAVATVVLWLWAARRAGLGAHRRALWDQVRGEPWAIGSGLLVLLGIALFRLTVPSVLHLTYSASWRYWADSMEVAAAGRIPAASVQYGALHPPIVSKVVLSTLNAGAIFGLGREAIPGMWAMLWVGSVGLAAALWSLGRELGLRYTAVLLPVFAVVNGRLLNPEMTIDLQTYKAEIFGRLVAFAALAVAVRALRRREGWRDAVLAGTLLGVAAGIHLVPVLIAVVVLVGYGAARLIADRRLLAVVGRGAVVIAVGAGLGAAILALPHGDLGLRGAGGQATAEGPRPPGAGPCFDPTLYLNSGALSGPTCRPDRWYLSPARSLRASVAAATRVGTKGSLGGWLRPLEVVVVAGGLVAALAMLVFFPRPLRATGLAAWGLLSAIVALTWLSSRLYHLYVPSWFGIRRLLDYSSIPLVLLGLALVEGALYLLARARPWMPGVAAALASLIAAGLIIPSAAAPAGLVSNGRTLVAPFTWIRTHVPCGARILADEHSEGVFEALTGRVAVLEGATPYLRPSIRDPIVRLTLQARAFFEDPPAHRSFLQQEAVDYVVLVRGGVGYRAPIGSVNRPGLDGAPFLRPVYSSSGMTIYRTASPAGHRASPFPCRLGPVAT